MTDWQNIDWRKAGQLPPNRQSIHTVAQWFAREALARGVRYGKDAKSFLTLLIDHSDPTKSDPRNAKPDLERRASRALRLSVEEVSRHVRLAVQAAAGARPYGLFGAAGRSYAHAAPETLGRLCDAIAGEQPDEDLQSLIDEHNGRFHGIALAGMSQIAHVLRPDLYPALNSRTGFGEWQSLVFNNDYSRFVELSQSLRALCDQCGFPSPHRFKYFDRYLEATGVVEVDHVDEGEARMGLPLGSLLKFYEMLNTTTSALAANDAETSDADPKVDDADNNTVFDVNADHYEADPEAEEGVYSPTDNDNRHEALRAIKVRLGQPDFRSRLLSIHRGRCQITGCTQTCLLEAAHIRPFRGERDHHEQNGLLLRTDIHTLFDRGLLWIEPTTRLIRMHDSIHDPFYRSLAGRLLDCARCTPSDDALRWHREHVVPQAVTD